MKGGKWPLQLSQRGAEGKREREAKVKNVYLDRRPLAGDVYTDAGDDLWTVLQTSCRQLQAGNMHN